MPDGDPLTSAESATHEIAIFEVRCERDGRGDARQLGRSPADGAVITAASPAALWRRLASTYPDAMFSFTAPGIAPNGAAIAVCAAELVIAECDIAVGRVEFGGGRRPWRVRRVEDLRFIAAPPGAAILSARALKTAGRALAQRPWDDWWLFDLVREGAAVHRVQLSEAVLATANPATAGHHSGLVPFDRAGVNAVHPGPMVLIYGPIMASVSLYFDGLPPDLAARVRFLRPGDPARDLNWLAAADVIVIAREFEELVEGGMIDVIRAMGTRCFWFTDDDFLAFGRQNYRERYYSEEHLGVFLSQIEGVVVSTPALGRVMAPFARRVITWPNVFDRSLAAEGTVRDEGVLRVGAVGGEFRRRSLEESVIPALAGLRSTPALELFVREELLAGRPTPAGVTLLPFEPSLRQFVRRWQALGLHALVHPTGAAENMGTKSPGTILVAAYLGAVAIVTDEVAYSGIGEEHGILKVEDTPAGWAGAVRRAADPVEREVLVRRLRAWCEVAFRGEGARAPFEALTAGLAGATATERQRRLERALSSPALDRARRYARTRRNRYSWRRRVIARIRYRLRLRNARSARQ